MSNPVNYQVLKHARKLKFPSLFIITAILFVVDLFVPDPFPFADELLLGLLTVLFGTWRERRKQPKPGTLPEKTGDEPG